jgi:hypothetical protein
MGQPGQWLWTTQMSSNLPCRAKVIGITPDRDEAGNGTGNEHPLLPPGMGNGQQAGAPAATAPQNDVEIQHSAAPTLAPAAAKRTLHPFQIR